MDKPSFSYIQFRSINSSLPEEPVGNCATFFYGASGGTWHVSQLCAFSKIQSGLEWEKENCSFYCQYYTDDGDDWK